MSCAPAKIFARRKQGEYGERGVGVQQDCSGAARNRLRKTERNGGRNSGLVPASLDRGGGELLQDGGATVMMPAKGQAPSFTGDKAGGTWMQEERGMGRRF